MKTIAFTKMAAAGNDFVIVDGRWLRGTGIGALAKKMCDRKYGVGADGLLIIDKSQAADARMRIINADGSEAEMCGNGARCAALYVSGKKGVRTTRAVTLQTIAGIIEAVVTKDTVRIKLPDVKDIRLDQSIMVNGRALKVNCINTGVPHTVVFAEGLDVIDVAGIGSSIRYNKKFAPKGTNVNFVEITGPSSIRVRTYERGVEAETLACGTGSTASALIFALKSATAGPVKVTTQGTEVLTVSFERARDKFSNVWLEGMPRMVYTGEYCHV